MCAVLDRLLQSTGAALLILLCSPLFLILAGVVFVADRRPILYAGERLGRLKRPFRMFKFRSLVHEAEAHIGGDIMNKRMASWVKPCMVLPVFTFIASMKWLVSKGISSLLSLSGGMKIGNTFKR